MPGLEKCLFIVWYFGLSALGHVPPTEFLRLWNSSFFDIASAVVPRRSLGGARKSLNSKASVHFSHGLRPGKQCIRGHARMSSTNPLVINARERPQSQHPR